MKIKKRLAGALGALAILSGFSVSASAGTHGEEVVAKSVPDVKQDSGLIATGAKVKLVNGNFEFIEGPVSDAEGTFFFTDIDADKIYKMSLDGEISVFREKSNHSNGMTLDLDGNMLMCEHMGQRISRMNKDGSITTVVDSYNGKRLNSPNDLWVHPNGSIYFTDPRYRLPKGPKPQPSHYVFRLAPDEKTITPVIGALPKPNGIIGTKDGKKLFISDTETVQVYSYDINEDGSLSNAQLFAKRFSDGMALDEHGNLYLSAEDGIAIFNPQGEEIEFIATPERPANSAFGGADGKTLYITARKGLYSIQMNVVSNLFKDIASN